MNSHWLSWIAAGLIAISLMQIAHAQPAPAPVAATQNTVQTTGPVTSDTTISVGTLAGQALTWIAAAFGVPIGTLVTAWLYRLFAKAGVDMTDAMRARLQEMVINGLNIGAADASKELAGKGQLAIKDRVVATAVRYVQEHGAKELKALGVDPMSNIAVSAITARIQTAITDASQPTPKVLDSVPSVETASGSQPFVPSNLPRGR